MKNDKNTEKRTIDLVEDIGKGLNESQLAVKKEILNVSKNDGESKND